MKKLLLSASLMLMSGQVLAAVSAAEADQLGRNLTPVGAEKAGNAAGTIPAWDGGIVKALPGHKDGGHFADPFPAEKPKFEITAANMAQYAGNLTPGQQDMLKKYPSWKLRVFPTHRTVGYPKWLYDATRQNSTKVNLAAGGNGFTGTTLGVPFPIPKTGVEAIWNHVTAYRGETFATTNKQVAVNRSGEYTPVGFDYVYDFHYNNTNKAESEREKNKLANQLATITAPARLAGQIYLVHEFIDQNQNPRQAWSYNPGQRRVRLAPNVAYDNPGTASDGLRTNDDFGIFNGATDRYDWKLLGKKEIYVPYNAYQLRSDKYKLTDIIKPLHINPNLARYELHRVWVVEATLKPGTSHIYSRRTFYLDEDSWSILVSDKYDARGQLWRVAEQHPIQFYDLPAMGIGFEVHTDLQSGRYLALGLTNEESKVYTKLKRSASDFLPSSLREAGNR